MDTLTKTQIKLLVRASADKVAAEKRDANTAKALIDLGLLIVEPDQTSGEFWIITEAGRAAIGVVGPLADHDKAAPEETPAAGSNAGQDKQAPRPTGKIGILVSLLERPDGANLTDLMAATSWQAHSVRGALSGAIKAKLGLAVTSEKLDGVRTYRIARDGAAQGAA